MAKPGLESDRARQFKLLSQELSGQFPDLDLRFNHVENSSCARCILPEYENAELEFELGPLPKQSGQVDLNSMRELLHEAIFAVKHITRRFDS